MTGFTKKPASNPVTDKNEVVQRAVFAPLTRWFGAPEWKDASEATQWVEHLGHYAERDLLNAVKRYHATTKFDKWPRIAHIQECLRELHAKPQNARTIVFDEDVVQGAEDMKKHTERAAQWLSRGDIDEGVAANVAAKMYGNIIAKRIPAGTPIGDMEASYGEGTLFYLKKVPAMTIAALCCLGKETEFREKYDEAKKGVTIGNT